MAWLAQCRGGYMPFDIVWEILLRLPVKSLLRFKSTCKSWRALISDPEFVSAHCERFKRKPKIIIRRIKSKDYSSRSDWRNLDLYSNYEGKRDPELLFHRSLLTAKEFLYLHPYHLNGLIMLNSTRYIHVCNPSTREAITLLAEVNQGRGSDHYRRFHDGLGHDPVTNKYKVVRLFFESDRTLRCLVYTIGVPGSWRDVENVPNVVSVLQYAVPLNGVLYWQCVKHEVSVKRFDLIIAFDLRDETFRFVEAPEEVIFCSLLLPMGKRLSRISFSPANPLLITVWTMQDSDHAWIKKYSFTDRSFERRCLSRALYGDDDDNVFICLQNDVAYYNLPTRSWRFPESTTSCSLKNKPSASNLSSSDSGIEFFHTIPYAQSLTSIRK